MKKFLKCTFVTIGILIVLSISLVIAIGIRLMDKEDNSTEEIVNNPIDTEVLINNYLVESMKDLSSDNTVDFMLTEYEASYLLDSIKKEVKIPFVNIRSMYALYNDDGTVTFEAPLSFFSFKSIVKGRLDIGLSSNGDLNVRISEIRAGKISSSSFIMKSFVLNNVNARNVMNELKKKGIYVEIDFSNDEFNLKATKENIKTTVSSLIKTEEKNLYNAIIEEVIGKDDLLKLYFNEEDSIGVKLFLDRLKNAASLDYDLENDSKNLKSVKSMAISLMNDGILNIKNSSVIFDFLVRGYDSLNEESKESIDSIDFTSIGIKLARQYKGIVCKSSLTMAKLFIDSQISDPLKWKDEILKGYYDITLSESNLNELFNSLKFIGTSFAFKGKDDIAYITISNLICDIKDEILDAYMVLDVNEYYIMANVHAIVDNSNGSILSLKIESASLGDMKIKEESKDSLLKYLSYCLREEEFINIDASSSLMSLDFSSYLKEGFFEFLINSGLSHVSIHLSSDNNGELIIRLSK